MEINEPSSTAARQRTFQGDIAEKDKSHPKEEITEPMQAGARLYPTPPFPRQHRESQALKHK
jgi:hypothetical protein